jgi:hypothetical protein
MELLGEGRSIMEMETIKDYLLGLGVNLNKLEFSFGEIDKEVNVIS